MLKKILIRCAVYIPIAAVICGVLAYVVNDANKNTDKAMSVMYEKDKSDMDKIKEQMAGSQKAAGTYATPSTPKEDPVVKWAREMAADAIEQYRIVKAHGSMEDRCLKLKWVTEYLLQAKEEKAYAQWKQVENADCRAAEFPGY
jgi:hypothetical protein